MQKDASVLDDARTKRLELISQREEEERKLDEAQRRTAAEFGGRGQFIRGMNDIGRHE